MTTSPKLPPRVVLAEVSRQDQRMMKWFEDVSRAVGVADGSAVDLAALENSVAALAVAFEDSVASFEADSFSAALDYLIAGTNITLTPDLFAGTITIDAAGGGGGGGFDPVLAWAY